MIQSGIICAFVWMFVQGVDRLLGWQTLQRPIVTAAITGLLLGDFKTGITMGASLEAVFMGISAIGGSFPSDGCSASIIAVAMTILAGSNIETGIALAMPIGTILATVNELWKIVLASFSAYWEKVAASGDDKKFLRLMFLFGIIVDRLPQTIIVFISVAFGVEGLQSLIAYLPEWVMNGFGAACGMMTAVGFAILTSMIWDKEIGCFFFVGFVLVEYLKLDMLAIAIIMGVVAIMYFYNDKKILESRKLVSIENETCDSDLSDEEDFF